MEFRELVAVALLLLGAGLVAPLRAARHWQGAWRLAALAPFVGLLLVVIRTAVALQRDRVSRGLFPWEVVLASLAAIVLTALLRLLHGLAETVRDD